MTAKITAAPNRSMKSIMGASIRDGSSRPDAAEVGRASRPSAERREERWVRTRRRRARRANADGTGILTSPRPSRRRRTSVMRARSRERVVGFTLAELMVVIVIIGLLATLVVPNVMGRLAKANFAKAKADIVVIA